MRDRHTHTFPLPHYAHTQSIRECANLQITSNQLISVLTTCKWRLMCYNLVYISFLSIYIKHFPCPVISTSNELAINSTEFQCNVLPLSNRVLFVSGSVVKGWSARTEKSKIRTKVWLVFSTCEMNISCCNPEHSLKMLILTAFRNSEGYDAGAVNRKACGGWGGGGISENNHSNGRSAFLLGDDAFGSNPSASVKDIWIAHKCCVSIMVKEHLELRSVVTKCLQGDTCK